MKKFYKILQEKITNALKECNYEDSEVVLFESNRKDLADYQLRLIRVKNRIEEIKQHNANRKLS